VLDGESVVPLLRSLRLYAKDIYEAFAAA